MVGEILISVSLIIGGVFGLAGSYGLLKLDNPMARLHAPTKASTLGVGSVLLASVFYDFFIADVVSVHEVLIMIFLFMTAPIAALFISKTHLHQNVDPDSLPSSGVDSNWAHVAGKDGEPDAQAETS